MITSKTEQDAFKKLSAIVSERRELPKNTGKELLPVITDAATNDMKHDENDDLENKRNGGTRSDVREETKSGDMADTTNRIVDEYEYIAEDDSGGGVNDNEGTSEKSVRADNANNDGINGTWNDENDDTVREAGNDVKDDISNATMESDGAGSRDTSFDPASPYSLEMREPLPQYLPLYEINPDFFGWIQIEGTKIDYPVMYSPDRPEYYIRRAFDGSVSNSGVPFVDENCPVEGNCYIIYGHHMKNQTMFGQLVFYAEKSYWEEHPVVQFDTLFEQRNYQVIAAFYSRDYGNDETGVFRYYEYADLSEEEVFNEYVNCLRAVAIYDTGFDITFGDELLVLSTCNYHVKDGRFVVVAMRNDR